MTTLATTAGILAVPGSGEILVICLVILVLFGAAAIPRFARSLGRAKKEFEEGTKEGAKPDEEKKSDR